MFSRKIKKEPTLQCLSIYVFLAAAEKRGDLNKENIDFSYRRNH
jgi:hypothetical protein